jgi:hypothetical protein
MEAVRVSSKRRFPALLAIGLILLVLLLGVVATLLLAPADGGKLFTQERSEPLNDVKSAKIDIDAGTGNLTIDGLNANVPLLASATLEYLENHAAPAWTVEAFNDQASLTLKADGGRQSGLRLPWQACNGETNWSIHLNPAVASDLTAHSGGGNVKLDLSGMAVTRVMADTGGGNMEVVLPDEAVNLSVTARTGAGNVIIHMPAGIAARIHAASGMGKVIVDPRFVQIGDNTYQSPDFESAANKFEITVGSGAGNVSVESSQR